MLPDSAFVIFETEEARKLVLNDKNFLKIAGKKLKFTQCPEPTDIIWENRVKEPRFLKFILGSVALLILFSLDLYSTFTLNDA